MWIIFLVIIAIVVHPGLAVALWFISLLEEKTESRFRDIEEG